MPIGELGEFEFVKTLEAGKYTFTVSDLNIKDQKNKDEEVIYYLYFELTESKTGDLHKNLLSVPIDLDNKKFSKNSKITKVLQQFGLTDVNSDVLNSLIGKEFTAKVVLEDHNGAEFPRIEIGTIVSS